MSKSKLNVPLLRKTLEHAQTNPKEVDLRAWAKKKKSGISGCLATIAAILAGHSVDWKRETLDGYIYTTDGELIEDVGRRELGLTANQAANLFYCDSLDDAWEVAECLTHGEISRPS